MTLGMGRISGTYTTYANQPNNACLSRTDYGINFSNQLLRLQKSAFRPGGNPANSSFGNQCWIPTKIADISSPFADEPIASSATLSSLREVIASHPNGRPAEGSITFCDRRYSPASVVYQLVRQDQVGIEILPQSPQVQLASSACPSLSTIDAINTLNFRDQVLFKQLAAEFVTGPPN